MILAKNLRKLLRERNLTVKSLSQLVGVPKSNINGWLQGGNPNLCQLEKVCRYFGIGLDQMVFGDYDKEIKTITQPFEMEKGRYAIAILKIDEDTGKARPIKLHPQN